MYVPRAADADLAALEQHILGALDDPRFVAIGEIGLDFFVPALKEPEMAARQVYFYREQLALARRYDLPVLLHVRRSQDLLLTYLRQSPNVAGIPHPFTGSFPKQRKTR